MPRENLQVEHVASKGHSDPMLGVLLRTEDAIREILQGKLGILVRGNPGPHLGSGHQKQLL